MPGDPRGMRRRGISEAKRRRQAKKAKAKAKGTKAAKPGSRVNSAFVGLVLVTLFLFSDQDFLGDQAGILAHRSLDRSRHVGIVAQEGLGILAPLPDPLAVIGEPGRRISRPRLP